MQGNSVTLTDPFGCSPELIGIGANLLNAALYAFVDNDYGMAMSVKGMVESGIRFVSRLRRARLQIILRKVGVQ